MKKGKSEGRKRGKVSQLIRKTKRRERKEKVRRCRNSWKNWRNVKQLLDGTKPASRPEPGRHMCERHSDTCERDESAR